MCSHDSWTNQQTLIGWLANVCSAIFKQSNKVTQIGIPGTYTTYTTESDADWSGNHNDRRSTTGYFFELGFSGGAVSCQTKNQRTVDLSSCESEYQGLAAAVQEATFLRSIVYEMGYQQMQATRIREDNQSCIKLANNPIMHKRSKHIQTRYHFMREKVDDNCVELVYTPTDQLATDLLTKALSQVKVEQHRRV